MANLEARYLLSKSVVRLRGQQVVIRNQVTAATTSEAQSTAELIAVGDPSAAATVTFPVGTKVKTTYAVTLRDDRRLTKLDVDVAGQGPTILKSAVGIVGTVIGAVLAVVNPLAGLAIGGAAASVAAGSRRRSLGAEEPSKTPVKVDDPMFVAYAKAFPVESAQLVSYRASAVTLTAQHSAASAKVAAAAAGDFAPALETLAGLATALRLVRAQAATFEDHYAAWCQRQITTTTERLEDVELDIDVLPTLEQLDDVLAAMSHNGADPTKLPEPDRTWYAACSRFGIAVSVDALPEDSVVVAPAPGTVQIAYRPATRALVRTWKISARKPERTFVASTITRVARRATKTAYLSIDPSAWNERKLSVSFNEVGEPSAISGERHELAAAAAGEVGGAVKGAIETGSGIATGLTPGSAAAALVARQLAVAKNRKELSPFLVPVEAEAAAQREALEEAVAIAELEARLIEAQAVIDASAR